MNRPHQPARIQHIQLLKDRVYDTIKENIINLSFLPGEQLIEQRLAEALGVSKSPIRDAFQRLEQEGLVHSVPYKGCFVADISTRECKELFQIREALEHYCLEYGLDDYTEEDIGEFQRIMDSALTHMDHNDENAALDTHLSFHHLIIKKSNNRFIASTYANMNDKMRRYIEIIVRSDPNRVSHSSEQHRNLLRAIVERKKDRALKLLRAHLFSILEDYLKLIDQNDILKRP